jgi:hypothetical protein
MIEVQHFFAGGCAGQCALFFGAHAMRFHSFVHKFEKPQRKTGNWSRTTTDFSRSKKRTRATPLKLKTFQDRQIRTATPAITQYITAEMPQRQGATW